MASARSDRSAERRRSRAGSASCRSGRPGVRDNGLSADRLRPADSPDYIAGSTVWNRPYILLCTAVLLCYTSQYLLIATLPLYVLDLGASVVVAGLVLSAFSVTSFGMRPIVGFLTDTKGRLNVLSVGALVLGITGFAFA